MQSASVKLRLVPTANVPDTRADGSRLSSLLTLAAMSLGYGVVQLDVTIVNTALSSIGALLGGGVSELQWVVSAHRVCRFHSDPWRARRSHRGQARVHDRICTLHRGVARLRAFA